MANGFSLTATAEPEVSSLQVKVLSALFGLLLVTGVVVGLVGFFVGHEHVYNVSREVPWGLMISTYAFFAITSTGLCLLAAISHVFGGNRLAPLANRMVWLSLITILSAFVVIGMEIASPWRMAFLRATAVGTAQISTDGLNHTLWTEPRSVTTVIRAGRFAEPRTILAAIAL